MVKTFVIVATAFVLVVIGAVAAIFGPLVSGAKSNLGGNPKLPFSLPLPQSWINFLAEAAHRTSPMTVLVAVLAVIALLVVYTAGTLLMHGLRRWKDRRNLWAQLRWRGRVSAMRDVNVSRAETGATRSEIESMWE